MNTLPEDKRREEMLRELELLPVWRQRSVPDAAPQLASNTAQDAAPDSKIDSTLDSKIAAPIPSTIPAMEINSPESASVEDLPADTLSAEELVSEAWSPDIAAQIAAPQSITSEPQSLEAVAEEIAVPAEAERAPEVIADAAVSAMHAEPITTTSTPANTVTAAPTLPTPLPAQTDPADTADYGSDDHAAEREYYAASPAAMMEYAESVEPDWYSQEELAAATPDRRAQIMGMAWQALQESVSGCHACQLHSTRTQTVFGVGDPQAQWLFVGEAPGSEEDKRGEPFVGQAGKLLDNMLAAIQLKRGEDVYIANVLKCRPPANRDPQGEEVQQCDPYIKRQVELIKPKLIVALGKFAAQSLLQSQASIASLRGGLHDFHGVPVIVTYHPAYLLRNLPDKARAWEDLCFARETMRGLQLQQATPSSA